MNDTNPTILANRDTNAQRAPSASPKKLPKHEQKESKNMDEFRRVLQARLNKDGNKYISPSDEIMSPGTKKLAAFKDKRAKTAKPQTLFRKAGMKSESGGGLGFEDVPSKQEDAKN